jgi:hypothetical protein
LKKCFSYETHRFDSDIREFYTPWTHKKKCKVTTIGFGYQITLFTLDVRAYNVRQRRVRVEWETYKYTTKNTICIETCPFKITYNQQELGPELVESDSKEVIEEYWDLVRRKKVVGPSSDGYGSGPFGFSICDDIFDW